MNLLEAYQDYLPRKFGSNVINGGKKKFYANRERLVQDTLHKNGIPSGHRRFTPKRKDLNKEQPSE